MKQRHEVLFNQLESFRSELLYVLENVSPEVADSIPSGFNNNIRWNMGHIYLDQFLWIDALTKENIGAPSQFNSWFGFGTSPASFNTETPSYEELLLLLKEQPAKIKEMYSTRLEEEFPPTEMGMFTIEQILIRTIFHEGMHLQAIQDIKKLI